MSEQSDTGRLTRSQLRDLLPPKEEEDEEESEDESAAGEFIFSSCSFVADFCRHLSPPDSSCKDRGQRRKRRSESPVK